MTSYMCYVFEFLLENDKFLVYVSQKSIFTIALFNRQKSFQKAHAVQITCEIQ